MSEPAAPERHWGRITDEAIRAVRARIGIPARRQGRQYYEQIAPDNVRNFALAMGDANRLYTDHEYARAGPWGAVVAPGTILFSTGVQEGRPLTAREREEGRGGALPGVHGMFSGADFEWYLPMQEGDAIFYVNYLADVQVKQGQFAGRELLEFNEFVYRNQRGEVVAKLLRTGMRTERDTAAELSKYKLEPHVWTDDELAEVDATYAAEQPRGATPRYWEDVQIGEELPRMVRGPFTATDAIAWKLGWGFDPFVRTGKVAYEYRRRHPEAYPRNALNIPDVPERVHWEHAFAREVGVPGYYDYGPQRVSWLGCLMTTWLGDAGWLKRLTVQVRRFNIEGDVQWLHGRVVDKGHSDGECWVACELWAENQRGEVTAPGRAVGLLPCRAHGLVRLPAAGQPPYPSWSGPDGKVTPILTARP